MPRKYQSFKDRATRMVFDRLEDEDAPSRYTVIQKKKKDRTEAEYCSETLRRWVNKPRWISARSQVCHGCPRASGSSRENAELRRANEILKTASAFRSGAGPSHDEMIRYIDMFRPFRGRVHLSGFG